MAQMGRLKKIVRSWKTLKDVPTWYELHKHPDENLNRGCPERMRRFSALVGAIHNPSSNWKVSRAWVRRLMGKKHPLLPEAFR